MNRQGLKNVLVLAAAAAVLSSCTFVFDTHLESDGSGVIWLGFSLPVTEAMVLENFGDASVEEICRRADFGGDSPEQIVPVYEEINGVISCTGERTFENVQELRAIYEDYGVVVDRLGKQGRRFEFDAVLDLTDMSMDNAGIFGEVDVDAGIEWRLTMPGTPTESNADEVMNSTFLWQIPLGGRLEMHAVSNTGGIPQAVLIVASAAVSVLILLGGFFLVTKRDAVKPPPRD
ncbi:MAG: hypothetical protein JXA97_11315 [Anaerolineales bacterium]|nr:hypothetical protein [Anaerolineales bacterium]